MTPENVWSLIQEYITTSGGEIKVDDTRRESDRMVLNGVKIESKVQGTEDLDMDGTSIVTIPQMTLRDIGGGKVEITTSPEAKLVTDLKMEDGTTASSTHDMTFEDSITIASGTEESPKFDFSTKRFEMTQTSSITGGEGDGALPMTSHITGEAMSGTASLDRSGEVQKIDYQIDLAKLNATTKGTTAATEEEPESSYDVVFGLDNWSMRFAGTMPEAIGTLGTDVPEVEGKLTHSSGPLMMSVSTDMAMAPFSAQFSAQSTKLDMDLGKTKLVYSTELVGLDVAKVGEPAPAGGSTSTFTSSGDVTFPETPENGETTDEAEADWTTTPGKILIGLSGVTPLFDRVAASGLVGAEEVMSAKMMLSFFTRPGPTPDSIEVELESTADGEVLINGQAMP